MPRIKVTVVGYYDADLEDYQGETSPEKIAAIDAANVGDDAVAAILLADEREVQIMVEAV